MTMQTKIHTIRKLMRIVERINFKSEFLIDMANDYRSQGDKLSANQKLIEAEGINEIRIEILSLVQYMENDLNNEEKNLYASFKHLSGIAQALEADAERPAIRAL